MDILIKNWVAYGSLTECVWLEIFLNMQYLT